MSDKEAVEAVHRAMIDAMGGWVDPNIARIALQAARPHILEEAARIAETATADDDRMDMQAKRQAAAAIRAAKENEE